MEATSVPRPTCTGLVPALLLPGGKPRLQVCASWVAKATVDCLNPVVAALAILSPMTLTSVSIAVRPDSDVLNAVEMPIIPPPGIGSIGTQWNVSIVIVTTVRKIVNFVTIGLVVSAVGQS